MEVENKEFVCIYCEKVCKNQNSYRNHVCRCKLNPNRNYKNGMLGKTSWNKGLTKADNPVIAQASIKASQSLKGKTHKPHTQETKEKLRQYAIKNNFGGFHMRRGIDYKGIKLDSSYELILAKDLDANNIKWERCKRFYYHYNGKLHYYTPDFYLPEYDIYLDPKNDYLINNINPKLGYKDIDKIHQVEIENNIKILILSENELD